jgi:hypothetical protein
MIKVVRHLVVENDGWIFDRIQAVSPADSPFAGTFVYSSEGAFIIYDLESVQTAFRQQCAEAKAVTFQAKLGYLD